MKPLFDRPVNVLDNYTLYSSFHKDHIISNLQNELRAIKEENQNLKNYINNRNQKLRDYIDGLVKALT